MTTLDFKIKDYDKILYLQRKLVELKIKNENKDFFLIGEHPHVITFGKRPGQEENLKVKLKNLYSENIKVRKISRGGFVTYHGPGQIVGYPIFDLRENNVGIRTFMNRLQEALIMTLKRFDIDGYTRPNLIGVWVNGGKIASIGLGVKKGISFHGFALNVNTDLKYFNYIVPCGISNIKMTSIEKIIGFKISLNRVKKECTEQILKNFKKKNNQFQGYEFQRMCI